MHAHIQQRIQGIINNLDQLPSIPDVASKVLTMVNDPDISFKAIAEEISKDQAITTNILKLCNSAYFSKGKEISSIDRAIVTLGIKEVKDIVIVAATREAGVEWYVYEQDNTTGDIFEDAAATFAFMKEKLLG